MAIARKDHPVPHRSPLVVADTKIYSRSSLVRAEQPQLGVAGIVLHRGAHAGESTAQMAITAATPNAAACPRW